MEYETEADSNSTQGINNFKNFTEKWEKHEIIKEIQQV